MALREVKYIWESLEWIPSTRNKDIKRAVVSLMPGEVLEIDNDWQVEGPVRVTLRYYQSKKRTLASYAPLGKDEFDLDNPLEYPCASCGADRLEPCIGFNTQCTFRVFSTKGGKL